MQTTWKKFNHDFNVDDYYEAFKIQKELIDEGMTKSELPLKADSVTLYQSQFQFPDIAKFDYSVDQLNLLEAAEKNLNMNMDNMKLVNAYISTAQKVAKNLEEKYGEQWIEPAEGEKYHLA